MKYFVHPTDHHMIKLIPLVLPLDKCNVIHLSHEYGSERRFVNASASHFRNTENTEGSTTAKLSTFVPHTLTTLVRVSLGNVVKSA